MTHTRDIATGGPVFRLGALLTPMRQTERRLGETHLTRQGTLYTEDVSEFFTKIKVSKRARIPILMHWMLIFKVARSTLMRNPQSEPPSISKCVGNQWQFATKTENSYSLMDADVTQLS